MVRSLVILLSVVAFAKAFDVSGEQNFLQVLEGNAIAAKNFTEGFVIGLQKTEKPLSKCYNSTLKAEASIGAVTTAAVKCAFLHIDQCLALSTVYDQIDVKLGVMSVDCKFPTLIQKIKELQQPAAYSQITWRFFMYQKTLTQKLQGAEAAAKAGDYTLAGKNIGYIVRVLFDFNVSAMEPDYEADVESGFLAVSA
jgi:hypothetical protein